MIIRFNKNLGMLLLGIWLALNGLIPLLNISFSRLDMLMMILSAASGILILLGK